VHVEEHDVGNDVACALVCFAARRDLGDHCVAERRKQLYEQRARIVVVFGDQDADLGGFTHLARICVGTE